MNENPNWPKLIRSSCERECYAEKFMARFDWFNHCFPGKCGLMDIDGTSEINGYVLLIEFKREPDALTTGQRLYLEHQDDNHLCLVAVVPEWRGEPVVTHCAVVRDGKLGPYKPCTYEQFCGLLEWWVARSQRLPTAYGKRGGPGPILKGSGNESRRLPAAAYPGRGVHP